MNTCFGWAAAGIVALLLGSTAGAQDLDYGDDSSEYARDGECDDRRFAGPGMATSLTNVNIGRDATDCRTAFDEGRVVLWDFKLALAATICSQIDFGDDTSEWAMDGTCDDPRFDGIGAAEDLVAPDLKHDASDCRRLCTLGAIALRIE